MCFSKHGFVFLTVLLLTSSGLFGQTITPVRLVDAPTAGLLPDKTLELETNLFDEGGIVQTIKFGIVDLINIGCSYGGTSLIGAGRVSWQPHVSVQARVRIVEETMSFPALAIGFDSQGFGPFAKGHNLNRFRAKSRGAYIVLSRNYSLLGDLGLHGGVNYSLESDDGDDDPSFWVGIDKNIWKKLEICSEYDFAMNDNENSSMTSKRGYLNAAVRWRFNSGFMFEVDIKNLLKTSKKDITGYLDERPEPSRELRFSYTCGF